MYLSLKTDKIYRPEQEEFILEREKETVKKSGPVTLILEAEEKDFLKQELRNLAFTLEDYLNEVRGTYIKGCVPYKLDDIRRNKKITEKQKTGYGKRLSPFIDEMQLGEGEPVDPKRFNTFDLLEREASYGKSGFALQFMLDTTLEDVDRYPL